MLLCAALFVGRAGAAELKMGLPLPPDSKEWDIVSQGLEKCASSPLATVNVALVSPGKSGPSMASQIKSGALAGGLVMMQEFGTLPLGQDAYAYTLPCLFRSTNEIDFIRGKLDEAILQKVSEGPFEAVAVVEFGPAYVMSSQPLTDPSDWAARKIWVPSEDAFSESLNAINLQTVLTPSKQVRSNLKRGVVDTVIVPATGAVIKRWHTRIRNVFDVPFVYSYGIWVLRDDALETFSAEERKVLRDQVAASCRDLGAAIRARNNKAREVLNRYGVTFIAPNSQMDEQWRKWAGALQDHLDVARQPSPDIQEALDEHLESCR